LTRICKNCTHWLTESTKTVRKNVTLHQLASEKTPFLAKSSIIDIFLVLSTCLRSRGTGSANGDFWSVISLLKRHGNAVFEILRYGKCEGFVMNQIFLWHSTEPQKML
jgi:hypothetical protein